MFIFQPPILSHFSLKRLFGFLELSCGGKKNFFLGEKFEEFSIKFNLRNEKGFLPGRQLHVQSQQ